jgi:hypothetical protein
MQWIDVIAFFATILIIWALGTLRAHRGRRPHRLGWRGWFHPLGFIVGNDNRLSLSRAQAFLWTMVIFGTYAAAWKAHKAVKPATPAAIEKITALATKARERAIESHSSALQRSISAGVAAEAKASAELDSALAFPNPVDSTRTAPALDSVRAALNARRKEAADARVSSIAADRVARIDSLRASLMEADAARYKWILIPAGLLALAGISIGSGLFSSLISAVNSTGVQPCITSIRAVRYEDLSALNLKLGRPRSLDLPCVVVEGTGLGHNGRVRFGSDFADVLSWNESENNMAIVVPPAAAIADGSKTWSGTLIIDTSNGKIAYGTRSGQVTQLIPAPMQITLGSPTDALEWSDLFRTDSNPSSLDLTKFQMFGWTIISVTLYLWNFFVALAAQGVLATLPSIDESLVILMGVSQAAYLTNKGVQNLAPPQRDTRSEAASRVPPTSTPLRTSGTGLAASDGLIPPDPQANAPGLPHATI